MEDGILLLVLVGVLWGCTNPLIKLGSSGITDIKSSSRFSTFLLQLKYLLINWKYLVPFILNQSGSLVYFYTLQNSRLSFSVPVANSLTFVFTAITGYFIGENKPSGRSMLGILLVSIGIICYGINAK